MSTDYNPFQIISFKNVLLIKQRSFKVYGLKKEFADASI